MAGKARETERGRERPRVARRVAVVAVLVAACLCAAFAWYASDYYHASERALSIIDGSDVSADGGAVTEDVTVMRLESGDVAFVPEHVRCGLSFYPGAKVEAESYAPLLERCAERGILCVLARFPANFAFFGPDAASRARGEFPEVDDWVVCGHSLGGVVAARYVASHGDDVDAVVFLASYPTADLSDFAGGVLSIVGTNDGVIRRDAYERARGRLPEDARELEIAGGNHANFGDYGDQDGDGRATISREEQQEQTAEAIGELVRSCVGA